MKDRNKHQEQKKKVISDYPDKYREIADLPLSDIVRLQEINSLKLGYINDVIDQIATEGELYAPSNAAKRKKLKKLETIAVLLDAVLEQKYEDIFEDMDV